MRLNWLGSSLLIGITASGIAANLAAAAQLFVLGSKIFGLGIFAQTSWLMVFTPTLLCIFFGLLTLLLGLISAAIEK